MGFFSKLFSKKNSKAILTCSWCQKTIEDGSTHIHLEGTESRACEACAPRAIAIQTFCLPAHAENREMTMVELQKYDALCRTKGIIDIDAEKIMAQITKDRGGETLYDSVSLDRDGLPVLTFTCPKCSNKG